MRGSGRGGGVGEWVEICGSGRGGGWRAVVVTEDKQP